MGIISDGETSSLQGDETATGGDGLETDGEKKKRAADQNLEEGKQKKQKLAPNLPRFGAYAKLEGQHLKTGEEFVAYVAELPATLGREHNEPPKNFISLGKDSDISDQHAVLDYDLKQDCFTLSIKSERGVLIKGVRHQMSDSSVLLKSKTPIRIGDIGFYLLLATFPKPKQSYAELALNVFKEVGEGIPLGTKELCDILEKKYRFFEKLRDGGGRATTLSSSLQQAVRRSESFLRAANIKTGNEKLRLGYVLSSDTSPVGIQAKQIKEQNLEITGVFDYDVIAKRLAEISSKPFS